MQETHSLPLPSAILWDLDGTLIDQTAAIIRAYSDVIQSTQGHLPDPELIRRSLGGPMAATMALFIDAAGLNEACVRFRKRFTEIMFDGLILLTGGLELVQCAHNAGILQGILTNKHGDTARMVSDYAGFARYIPTCIGNTDTTWHKPQAALTHYTLKQINASANGACIIGDSPTDIETAYNAGLPCYCVATGAHSRAELSTAGATATFTSLFGLKTAFGL